jgi:hypothetical protein
MRRHGGDGGKSDQRRSRCRNPIWQVRTAAGVVGLGNGCGEIVGDKAGSSDQSQD